MDCTLRFSLMLAAAIVLAVSPSFGQGRSRQWGTPASSAIHIHFEPNRESGYYKENPLEQIPVDDLQSFLLDTKGTFVYLGSFKQTNNGQYFPSGLGLIRTVAADSTGNSSYEYCLSPWKRGFRHGEGIVRLADGNYAKVTWRWGRQKSVSNSVPTDAEIEELEQRIKRFELLFGLIGH